MVNASLCEWNESFSSRSNCGISFFEMIWWCWCILQKSRSMIVGQVRESFTSRALIGKDIVNHEILDYPKVKNMARLQLLENELMLLAQGSAMILQYFLKVKNMWWNLELEADKPMSKVNADGGNASWFVHPWKEVMNAVRAKS